MERLYMDAIPLSASESDMAVPSPSTSVEPFVTMAASAAQCSDHPSVVFGDCCGGGAAL